MAWWILGIAAAGAGIAGGWQWAVSVLLGGLLAMVNLAWMTAGIDRVLGTGKPPPAIRTGIGYVARLLLLLLGFFAMIQLPFLKVWGGLLGLSVFVFAGILEAGRLLLEYLLEGQK